MIKTAKEMVKGDVYECEFGDFGNFVKVVFESCEPDGDRWTKIHFHHIGMTDSDVMYDMNSIDRVTFNVVGREEDFA